jgi:hypothetical protein
MSTALTGLTWGMGSDAVITPRFLGGPNSYAVEAG